MDMLGAVVDAVLSAMSISFTVCGFNFTLGKIFIGTSLISLVSFVFYRMHD